jgi:hypothetical protein
MTGENDCNTANADFLTLQDPPSAHPNEEHWNVDTLIAPEDVSLPSTPSFQSPRIPSSQEVSIGECFLESLRTRR